jgi:8-oxo-dGTP diphosphatase
MAEPLVFGSREPGVQYTERRAAYVVVVSEGGEVAAVESRGKHFLPGGGSLPGEAPEETITREVCEELGRGVRLTRPLGEAIQYFYSETDGRHYEMRATFFAGLFTGDARAAACEHELCWLPASEADGFFFHACHAWAARRG